MVWLVICYVSSFPLSLDRLSCQPSLSCPSFFVLFLRFFFRHVFRSHIFCLRERELKSRWNHHRPQQIPVFLFFFPFPVRNWNSLSLIVCLFVWRTMFKKFPSPEPAQNTGALLVPSSNTNCLQGCTHRPRGSISPNWYQSVIIKLPFYPSPTASVDTTLLFLTGIFNISFKKVTYNPFNSLPKLSPQPFFSYIPLLSIKLLNSATFQRLNTLVAAAPLL